MLVLTDDDVAALLELPPLLDVIEDAFAKQGRGEVERPRRPHFPVGFDPGGRDASAGTALTMPAYLHGAAHYATKLASVHGGNPDRGLPTVNARIALFEAGTGRAAAYIAGTDITNARTACVGGLAARELAAGPVTLALLGAGTQARWQARTIAAATDVESIRVYSPSDSKRECAADLADELGVPAEAVGTPADAVGEATVVVTATTASEPVFPGDALAPGTLVVAVGAYDPSTRELDARTIERAARVFADVPDEAAETGDVLESDLGPDDLVPFSDLFLDGPGREGETEILVVESVGSATLDAAAAEHVYERARERGVGTAIES